MQEKTLLKISLVTSIAGVVLLFFISLGTGREERAFELLEPDDYAVVSGRIGRVTSKGNVTFLSVYQSMPVSAVVIGKDYVEFREGDYVQLRGKVERYKDRNELIVEEIRKT